MFNLIGKTLGQYRILEKIGVGGMATVYKAFQPSMDRYVAVKVLPPQLSDDEQFVKRFQREAHAIAKLEHAHILPVFDYGETEGITYIVMRYIPAGTLKEYLTKGRLPLDEVARIIGQIGSALDYAHQLGVIHRDVKPNNVLMGEQDNTYLTDFGLARMLEVSQQLTGSGVGVGTPAYMAPEQGLGNKADHRSDIYSLGVILYEMVTGHVPYEAETPMAVVLKHINEPLPLPRTLLPDVPEAVELVILKALAKEPAHRYQSAADLVEALNAAVRKASPVEEKHAPAQAPAPVVEAVPTSVEPPSGKPRWTFWQRPRMKPALAVVALAIFIALGFLLKNLLAQGQANLPVTLTPAVGKTTITTVVTATPPPSATAFGGVPGEAPTESTQAKRVFYCEGLTPMQICVLDVQSGKITQITKDLKFEGQMGTIAWSPDGKRLVFSGAQRSSDPEKLFTLNADGTDLKQLSFGPTYDHQSVWSPDGQWIAFARSAGLGLIRPDGSEAHTVLPPPENCGLNAMAWSPDSRRVALIKICDENLSSEVWVVNLDGSDRLVLHSIEPGVFAATMAWSPDGSQIVAGYEVKKEWHRVLLNADGSGKPQGIDWEPDNWDYGFWPQWGIQKAQAVPATVPGAECRVVSLEKADSGFDEVFVRNCDGSARQQLTNLGTNIFAPEHPVWSPDRQLILFVSRHEGNKLKNSTGEPCTSLYVIHPDGTGLTRLTRDRCDNNPAWSPDGKQIAFHRECDLAVMKADGTGTVTIARPHEKLFCIDQSAWSPDGQRIAFTSLKWPEPGRLAEQAVFVVNPDGSNLTRLATVPAEDWVEYSVVWSPDGAQVAFRIAGHKYIVNADGGGEPKETDNIPDSWYPWYWPQWGIEKAQPIPTPAPAAVAECRVAYVDTTNINEIFVRNCDGSHVRQITHGLASPYHEPSWSPDGQRLVFDDALDGTKNSQGQILNSLYIVNVDGSGLTRLTKTTSGDWFPSWSPDGSLIVFHGGGAELSIIHPDGTNLTPILPSGKLVGSGGVQMFADQPVWSPDSQHIAFIASPEASQVTPAPDLLEYRFYAINVDGSGLVELFSVKSKTHRAGSGWAAWSPDGKLVAFEIILEEGGPAKYYIVNSDGSGGLKEINSIPESWHPWHWPQWDKGR